MKISNLFNEKFDEKKSIDKKLMKKNQNHNVYIEISKTKKRQIEINTMKSTMFASINLKFFAIVITKCCNIRSTKISITIS